MSLSGVLKQRVEILNKYGEKLVGALHSTGSKNLVILCHGAQCTKDEKTLLNLIATLTGEGISAFHFDFSGNGESQGEFQFGNYHKETDDLRSVVLYFSEKNFKVCAISGHSKGGNDVILYASMYKDVHFVINISGRFALERDIDKHLGKNFMQILKQDGFIDIKHRTGKAQYRVTEKDLMDRLSTDMRSACHAIDKECRVLTIHGSADEIVPVEDAFEFDKLIPNHRLQIVEGADHCYTSHQENVASLFVDFIKSSQVVDAIAAEQVS